MDSRLQVPISVSALAVGFGCGLDRVKNAHGHGLESPEKPGRHLATSDDAKRETLNWIQINAAKNKVMTPRDLREHITTNYNLPAMRG
jgi:hypothetical protein